MAAVHGPRRILPAGVIAVLMLTGCISVTVGTNPPSPGGPAVPPVSSSSSPSASPAPSPDPETCTTNLSTYRLDVRRTGSVTADDEQVVTSALRLSQRHFDVRVPGCEAGGVTASVLDRESERFAAGTVVNGAPQFEIEVYAGGSAWARTPRSQVPLIMLHEWYHVVQYSFLGCDPPRCHAQDHPIPAWLIEGSAEYEAARAAKDERLIFYSFIRRYELLRAAQVETPLQRIIEARTSAHYGLSFAAVELLVQGRGPDALMDFWEAAGSSGRWESAFPDAFGTTPTRFYRTFAAYRARGFHT